MREGKLKVKKILEIEYNEDKLPYQNEHIWDVIANIELIM
jgi:hypothetical protein